MEDWAAKLIAFLASFLMSIVFGLLPILFNKVEPVRRDRILAAANAFAGGTFLAGGFVHLLDEGDDFFDDMESPLPIALVLCCVGLLVAFFIEKVLLLCCS
jgi:ZIP Zinc transporter